MSLPGLAPVSRPAAAAASRQKSCNACVRSKRRCDKRTPRCTRCATKRALCIYGGRADLGDTATAAADLRSLELAALSAPATGALGLECLDVGMPMGSALGLSPLQFDVVFDYPSGDTLPGLRSPDRRWQDSFLEQNAEIAAAAEVALAKRDYSRMQHICVRRLTGLPALPAPRAKD